MYIVIMNIFILLNILISLPFISCSDPEVVTNFGTIRGSKKKVHVKYVDEFLGIPYAKPPIGDLRFAKPQEWTDKWTEPLIAQKIKASCFQASKIEMSEDCLYLSIWTPNNRSESKLLPVMLWIHGGGFSGGSGSSIFGGILSCFTEIVVISINYRLNAFGFLFGNTEDVPGNVGLYDQSLAMKWVRENIIKFGGDPNLITIFGESAGGWSVSLHLISPISKPYFDRAIAMSGIDMDYLGVDTKEYALKRAAAMAKAVGCEAGVNVTSLSAETVKCLRSKDAAVIVKALAKVTTAAPVLGMLYPSLIYLPIFGEAFIPKAPREMWREKSFKSNCSILVGTVFDEFVLHHWMKPKDIPSLWLTYFFLKFPPQLLTKKQIEELLNIYYTGIHQVQNRLGALRAANQFYSDVTFHCPTAKFSEMFSTIESNSVYRYVFNYKSKGDNPGCDKEYPCHGSDIPFTFGGVKRPEDINPALFWMKILSDFSKTGKAFWPKYYWTKEKQLVPSYYEFKGYFDFKHMQIGFRDFRCRIWDSMVSKPNVII